MRVISMVNLKGGVAKTTTAVNMADILAAEHGKRVLVVDADAQASATKFYGMDGSDCNTLADLLSGDCVECVDEYIYKTKRSGVNLTPSEISLIQQDIASAQSGSGGAVKRFGDFIAGLREDAATEENAEPLDYIIIDCPPSFTAASVAAIAASDDVIIPLKVDAFAVEGMAELMGQIDGLRMTRPGIRVAGILITMWHNSPAVVQGEALLREKALPVFRQTIRRSDKVDESTFMRQPVREYSPTCAATRDYRKFVAEYLEGV